MKHLLAVAVLVVLVGCSSDPDTATVESTTTTETTTQATEPEPTATTSEPETTEGTPVIGASALIAQFEARDLPVPNRRDNTDNCDGDVYKCSEWITTDLFTVITWDTPEAAQAYIDTALVPADTVLAGAQTTVGYQSGGTTPDYDRPAYQAVIDTL